MAGSDDIGIPGSTARRALSAHGLIEALATVVPVRGTRLHHLAQTIATNVERDLFESDLDHRDSEARRMVIAQHVQLLRDAVKGTGAFARDSASLLSIRWADRAAFEAYAEIHTRLCPAGIERSPGSRTTREMLLALRLRMARLDWESIAEIFEALGHPCDETTLRKRQSRLASTAVIAMDGDRQWQLIDRYLKTKRRSYGGTPRKFPLAPLTIFLLITAAVSAAAWVYLREPEPTPPEPPKAAAPAQEPQEPPGHPPAPEWPRVPPPSSSAPNESPPTERAEPTPTIALPLSLELPKSLFPTSRQQTDTEGRANLFSRGSTPFCSALARTKVIEPANSKLWTVLTDFSGYPKWMPGVTLVEGSKIGDAKSIVRAELRNRASQPVDSVWEVQSQRPGQRDSSSSIEWITAPGELPPSEGFLRLPGSDMTWSVRSVGASRYTVLIQATWPAPADAKDHRSCSPDVMVATLQALKAYVESPPQKQRQ